MSLQIIHGHCDLPDGTFPKTTAQTAGFTVANFGKVQMYAGYFLSGEFEDDLRGRKNRQLSAWILATEH